VSTRASTLSLGWVADQAWLLLLTDENSHQPFPVHPGRPVGTAYMLHLKAILLNPDASVKERVMKSGVGWTAFVRHFELFSAYEN